MYATRVRQGVRTGIHVCACRSGQRCISRVCVRIVRACVRTLVNITLGRVDPRVDKLWITLDPRTHRRTAI